MKFRPNIAIGDFKTKLRNVTKFLQAGHKVKLTVTFRGREVSHPDRGLGILWAVAEAIGEIGRVEGPPPSLKGRTMTMMLTPRTPPRPPTTATATV